MGANRIGAVLQKWRREPEELMVCVGGLSMTTRGCLMVGLPRSGKAGDVYIANYMTAARCNKHHTVFVWNSLQPNCDGLEPRSDGLHPTKWRCSVDFDSDPKLATFSIHCRNVSPSATAHLISTVNFKCVGCICNGAGNVCPTTPKRYRFSEIARNPLTFTNMELMKVDNP